MLTSISVPESSNRVQKAKRLLDLNRIFYETRTE